MAEEEQSPGGVEFSNISNSEISTGDITVNQTAGGDIVSRDKNIFQPIINLFTSSSEQHRDLRNRQLILTAVRKFWIEGVLENSLHGAALIELGMEEKKEAVNYPWDMVLQRPDQPNRQLPFGTKMIDIFDQTGRSLLVLGEPGSGKTTMLLELTRQTIDRASKDLAQPIPVVFNLSSWAKKRSSLSEWLVGELRTRYSIPNKLAQRWVEQDELLLLLDGLDEMAPEYQAACVEAINTFHQQNLTPLVVCSRVTDYETLLIRLNLEQAIILQPLTEEQIEAYLDQFEIDLSPLKNTLQQDSNLQELARSPLMLNIMTLAYQGLMAENLPHLGSVEVQRQHLFDVYIQQMLERRGSGKIYSAEKTRHWLGWLAAQMLQQSETVFLIDRLQPGWLYRAQRRQYQVVLGLAIGLIVGLLVGLIYTLILGPINGLVVGVMFGLLIGATFGQKGEMEPILVVDFSKIQVKWALPFILFFGLIGGTISGLSTWLSNPDSSDLGQGLAWGLSFGLFITLNLGLGFKLLEDRTTPNQGIHQSLKNFVVFGLFFGVSGGLMSGLTLGAIDGITVGLSLALSYGMMLSGGAFVKHFFLRYICYRHGYMPGTMFAFSIIQLSDFSYERSEVDMSSSIATY